MEYRHSRELPTGTIFSRVKNKRREVAMRVDASVTPRGDVWAVCLRTGEVKGLSQQEAEEAAVLLPVTTGDILEIGEPHIVMNNVSFFQEHHEEGWCVVLEAPEAPPTREIGRCFYNWPLVGKDVFGNEIQTEILRDGPEC